MVIVGVTGGIGSGKTQFCEVLESFGAQVFYADQVAIDLMQSNKTLKQKLVEAFGKSLYNDEGTLQRSILAEVIFEDASARKRVESWVHPAVLQETRREVTRAKKKGVKLFVKEAALLLNHGRPEIFDHIVVITSDKETRIQRVMKHRGWAREQVLERMEVQMRQEEMEVYADSVIENSGTLAQLHSAALAWMRTLIPS